MKNTKNASNLVKEGKKKRLSQLKKQSSPPILTPLSKKASSHSKSLTCIDPLTLYLGEIRKYPLLDKKEELRIAKKYRETGDIKWAEILVTSNLRFVVKIAAEYSQFGAQMIDLIQEGNVGLMKAVKQFNPYKNVKLITYAAWWIRGYIQEHIMKQYSQVKIGTTQKQRKLFYQLQKEEKESLEREGKPLLMSQKWDIPSKDIQSMRQRLQQRDLSLDSLMEKGSENSLKSMYLNSQEKNMDERLIQKEELESLKTQLSALREDLNKKEIFILEKRLLSDSPLTLQDIGKKYGTTREAVRQIEARLIKKIKSRMESLL